MWNLNGETNFYFSLASLVVFIINFYYYFISLLIISLLLTRPATGTRIQKFSLSASTFVQADLWLIQLDLILIH